MIVLEPEGEGSNLVAHTVGPVSDEYYAMMDSGTNAIIVRPIAAMALHPDMSGEIAECKVPSATVERPIVQMLKYRGERRLVVALRRPAILISQEWLTTVARWTIIADSQDGVSQILAYTSTRGSPKTLSMKNGLPYLSKELFWQAMEDIASQTTLVSGHPWPELMIKS